MKTFRMVLDEDVFKKRNRWYDANITEMSEAESEKLWDMFVLSYQKIGMQYDNKDKFDDDIKTQRIMAIDIHDDHEEDNFILYKKTKYGKKITSCGTDGQRDSIRAMVSQLIMLLNQNPYYIEASEKLAEILLNKVPQIKDPDVIEKVIEKEIKYISSSTGRYLRKITSIGYREKVLYGLPDIDR